MSLKLKIRITNVVLRIPHSFEYVPFNVLVVYVKQYCAQQSLAKNSKYQIQEKELFRGSLHSSLSMHWQHIRYTEKLFVPIKMLCSSLLLMFVDML